MAAAAAVNAAKASPCRKRDRLAELPMANGLVGIVGLPGADTKRLWGAVETLLAASWVGDPEEFPKKSFKLFGLRRPASNESPP
mmetsp:Transcript_6947/g.13081  ORF Transcript_6947/g.13081 Transcript_6947/m.13081 type:complete len:84 (+) Transcript_6947:354-605(+)